VHPPIEGKEPIMETVGAPTLGASEATVDIAPGPAETERAEERTIV
jgi:hypothetical protein